MKLTRAFSLSDVFRLKREHNQVVILPDGWQSAVTGTGTVSNTSGRLQVITGNTASSMALYRTVVFGCGGGTNSANFFDFSKKSSISFPFMASVSIGASKRYLQIKAATTHGDLAAAGIGIKLVDLVLYGESFGTEHGEVELMTLTTAVGYNIAIEHDPTAIKWYVNGVLKGTQSTAAKIPSVVLAADSYIVGSVDNADVNTSCRIAWASVSIAQEV
jgi:hypothetical protein